MTVDIRPFPRLGWDPLPYEECIGVVGRMVVRQEDFFVAQLRFSEHATTIHEHPGERDTIVVCLEGEGFTFVAGETASLSEGQQVRWPKGITHRLRTEGSTMTTLMVERTDSK